MSNQLREALKSIIKSVSKGCGVSGSEFKNAVEALAQDDWQKANERPNADVIRAYASGKDVYYFEDGLGKPKWVLFDPEGGFPYIGDSLYEWCIGQPPKQKD